MGDGLAEYLRNGRGQPGQRDNSWIGQRRNQPDIGVKGLSGISGGHKV